MIIRKMIYLTCLVALCGYALLADHDRREKEKSWR